MSDSKYSISFTLVAIRDPHCFQQGVILVELTSYSSLLQWPTLDRAHLLPNVHIATQSSIWILSRLGGQHHCKAW